MIDTLAVAWAGSVLVSMALDTLAKPKVAPWSQRKVGMILLHMATVSWLFVLFLSLFGRAWFALACTVGLLALLVTVSNAKFNALREPVVFSDLALFAQSIRHPRLYLPYLSWMQVLALVPAVALFALTFWLDSALNLGAGMALGLMWVALFLVQIWLARAITLQLNPEQDQAQQGFLGVFVTYLLKGLSLHEIRQVQAQLNASPYANINVKTTDKSGRKNADAPDVLVIQSESFFDIRRTGLRVAPGLLGHFDALQQSGICSGALAVPAWGANTMRTEHAFLSGVSNAALRYASFYPYAFVTRATPAMPRAFKTRGYRCTAVHPYPADFFLRHKVFPRLGFDEFVDEVDFAGASREGPYVSDAAVTDWLIRRLDQPADQPQFLFAVTMENHGPLHLEKASALEAAALYQRPNGEVINDLTVYLRHLANANQMLGRLQDFLTHRHRKTLLCFYGDHVPGMGHVYDALMVNPQSSDFLVWGNQEAASQRETPPESLTTTPEQLGLRLAQIAGVM